MTQPKTPTDVLPEHPDDPRDRSMILRAYALSNPPVDGFENYGDATPEHHGGIWVTWDEETGKWTVYTTQPATELLAVEDLRLELGESVDFDEPGHQHVRRVDVYPGDVMTVEGEWSDAMERYQSSLTHRYGDPSGSVVDGKLTKHIAGFATGAGYPLRVGRVRDPRNELPPGFVLEDSYADVLEFVGVEPAEGEL